MATTTSHFALSKPAYSDSADIDVINGNMDKIDTEIYKSRCLFISKNSVTSLPVTITNTKITSTMLCVKMYLTNRLAMWSGWTVSTADGSVTVDGTTSGSSTNIWLFLVDTM